MTTPQQGHCVTCPAFDTTRLVRNLERTYRLMWENHLAGNPPQPLATSDGDSC